MVAPDTFGGTAKFSALRYISGFCINGPQLQETSLSF
jgi:hypothetical protein